MTHLWFLLTISFILLELSNPGLFYFLSLALGSGLVFLISMNWFSYYPDIATQCIIFFPASLMCFFMLHLFVKKGQKHKTSKVYLSNMYLLVGKTVEITSVDNECPQSGYGRVSNEIWPVKVQNNHNLKIQELKIGMTATIIGVQGCHLQITVVAQN